MTPFAPPKHTRPIGEYTENGTTYDLTDYAISNDGRELWSIKKGMWQKRKPHQSNSLQRYPGWVLVYGDRKRRQFNGYRLAAYAWRNG
ncbi:MAG: hypothetical protein GTO60_16460 [Gammaproteobacteria bacterium]|nr:hypothetical protein [Gammaproteobacteria bacterium]